MYFHYCHYLDRIHYLAKVILIQVFSKTLLERSPRFAGKIEQKMLSPEPVKVQERMGGQASKGTKGKHAPAPIAAERVKSSAGTGSAHSTKTETSVGQKRPRSLACKQESKPKAASAALPTRSVKPKTEKAPYKSPNLKKKEGKPKRKSTDVGEQGKGSASNKGIHEDGGAEIVGNGEVAPEHGNKALSKLAANMEETAHAQQPAWVPGTHSEAAFTVGMHDWTPGLRINMVATETVRNALTPLVPEEIPGLEYGPKSSSYYGVFWTVAAS
jgi:hypothetical protein